MKLRSDLNTLTRLVIPGLGVAVILLLAPADTFAQGGPPLMTDDPGTPGPGYWEINIASVLEQSKAERRLEAPLADVNYGVGQRIQLKAEIPWVGAFGREESAQFWVGHSLLGVKWRFFGQEGGKIAWSIYPQVEVSKGRLMTDKGLVPEGRQFLLPTEIAFQVRQNVTVNAEAGRTIVQNGDNGGFWGLSTGIDLRRLELLGELHGEWSGPEPVEMLVNGGGLLKMTHQMSLLMAAGGAVHGPREERPNLRVYFGLQFTLPRAYSPSQTKRW